ncbi:2Fe-2S ferredoxin [Aquimarina sp. BL5]|uniref:2Fe-2S iron-sulfur cluster-binding protein n=1 Tax=Aquimarina sp. BL5 TaxID=1714860 RepID=UPI000E468A8E|nr:2Fe-2S iron-sulfur cluster-binding protein [Aquimarina sp. BL5]AXT50265.1 2Fe-2S ferredoxin [Aquimarina sp. BL5]RKN07165.1 2Fe-2S ferredoxin [Aquimarina sp. BL5]
MAKITFVTSDDIKTTVEATTGNIMELAVQNKIKGIDGNCGGVCSCATCHVHVQPEDWSKIGEPSELEKDMLEFDENVSEYSRLSCQIKVSDAIDGIVLKVAN